MSQVLIIHGWSDSSKSFGPLIQFLRRNGYQTVTLWLGDYISLDDDVRIEDVAKRLEAVVRERIRIGELRAPFDVIVHSTGGLVAREWLSAHYAGAMNECPVKRLIMLAPANFGSRLAAMGKSMLGRLVKGWHNWFHTGTEMLNALELASPYQWGLAERDLFVPEGARNAPAIYGDQGVYTFVIVGTHPYTSALRQIINEDGSDGTVRVPAANLNVRGITIDFAADEDAPALREWRLRHNVDIPFAVLPDRTHGSIITPQRNEVRSNPPYDERLGNLILEALACGDGEQYRAVARRWYDLSEQTARLHDDAQLRAAVLKGDADGDWFHQYLQVNVRIVDDHGLDVGDYFLEFSGPDDEKGDRSSVYFHREVLEDVHNNGLNPAYRCLYVDRTDLVENYYERIRGDVAHALFMSVSATPPGDNVGYFSDYKTGARGSVPLHFEEKRKSGRRKSLRWLRRNCTHFVKIIIPRSPKDRVFRMTKA